MFVFIKKKQREREGNNILHFLYFHPPNQYWFFYIIWSRMKKFKNLQKINKNDIGMKSNNR